LNAGSTLSERMLLIWLTPCFILNKEQTEDRRNQNSENSVPKQEEET